MITRVEFAQIDLTIKQSIIDALDFVRQNYPMQYILFLADGELRPEFSNPQNNYNPYVIDNRIDRYKDQTRLKLLSDFLTLFYAFPSSQVATDDNEQRIHMELMIYTHIWESKPFLKKLFRLANLYNGSAYEWNAVVPDMGKHDFIRMRIRDVFASKNHSMAGIITSGFHTSLRNAFAHSEYSFDTPHNRIWLDNYKGANWELQEVSYDDWSRRFVYSALLSYHLLVQAHTKRISIIQDLGTNTFQIDHPTKTGGINKETIEYRLQFDSFNFARP